MSFCTKLAKKNYFCYNIRGGDEKNEGKNI